MPGLVGGEASVDPSQRRVVGARGRDSADHRRPGLDDAALDSVVERGAGEVDGKLAVGHRRHVHACFVGEFAEHLGVDGLLARGVTTALHEGRRGAPALQALGQLMKGEGGGGLQVGASGEERGEAVIV